MSQKFEPASSREKTSSETATSAMPAPMSQRDPMRSESFPAGGAMRMISIVIGRNVAPASVAE
jgi:hypothetical protein